MRPVKERGNDMHDGFEVSGSGGGGGWLGVCVSFCVWVFVGVEEYV